MLGNGRVAEEVLAFLESQPQAIVVLDPVLRSSSGAALIDPEGVRVVREELLRRVGWVTPNLEELAILAGEGPVEEAAGRLQKMAGGGLKCGGYRRASQPAE